MILKVLMENTAISEKFVYEHGLSFYIETEKHKILFDMGQSDAFIKNAEESGVNLEEVDVAVLSHGHYDHGGGLEAFLKINNKAKIYINSKAFDDYYSVDGRYLGLNKELKRSNRIIFTDDELKIDDELYLFTANRLERKYHMGTFGLLKKEGDKLLEDDFLHEQYLMIKEENRNILISGCSHKGILNITEWVKELKIDALFGGFHFMKLDVEKDYRYLEMAAKKLMEYKTKYYTCHCTGESQFFVLKKLMGDSLEYIKAGTIIKI